MLPTDYDHRAKGFATMSRHEGPHVTGSQPSAGNGAILELSHYSFKRAETPHELEQVHHLNYQTFVREVRQYADPGTDYLIDKYHHKNQYIAATIPTTCWPRIAT